MEGKDYKLEKGSIVQLTQRTPEEQVAYLHNQLALRIAEVHRLRMLLDEKVPKGEIRLVGARGQVVKIVGLKLAEEG